ncbi:MAG: PKD domain-containing protein [Deltaproteobacteria bacterium]|nr:PKD domain-containing protein [Deltaproteobacteria bacterium]
MHQPHRTRCFQPDQRAGALRAAVLLAAVLLVVGLGLLGCGATTPAAADAQATTAAPVAALHAPDEALVGADVTFDASASTDAVRFRFVFGDGATVEGEEAVLQHRFDAAGRYSVGVEAIDALGRKDTAVHVVAVTRPAVFAPAQSSSVAFAPAGDQLAVAVADADHVALFARDASGGWAPQRRLAVCAGPRSVAYLSAQRLAVACEAADRVELHDPSTTAATTLLHALPMRWGAQPTALLVAGDGRLLVSAQGEGRIYTAAPVEQPSAMTLTVVASVQDPRGLARWPDGRVVVSRWRSAADAGTVTVIDPAQPAAPPQPVAVLWADLEPADSVSGGVPSYLGAAVVLPDGRSALVPGTHANNRDGVFRNGLTLEHDTAIRAIVAQLGIDAAGKAKDVLDDRWIFENRGLAAAAVASPRGDWLYVAMRGSRSVDRLDLLRRTGAGAALDLGYAPEGLAVSPDGTILAVDASLSREVVLLDTTQWPDAVLARLPTVATEPLPAEVLRGKQLFNDSFDQRLALDGYIACAHCHLDAAPDLRTWDFTQRGEGMRNTPDLRGRGGTAHGPVHWSANFDEIQDFEHDIRNAQGGTGLLSDADFALCSDTLGTAKAGRSADLDALAAYLASLTTFPRSAARPASGALSPQAQAGAAIFARADVGCAACHSGAAQTDSSLGPGGVPLLHDVGTLGPGSGKRLGGPLPGLDTPTTRGLFGTAPYLHDGSAPTLAAVLARADVADGKHGALAKLTAVERAALLAYLQEAE